MNAQVYGVSIDAPATHAAYRKQIGLPDDLVLLSDFNRDFGRAYGILTTNAAGLRDILKRTVFVIGPDGTITYRWDNPTPPGLPQPDEVLEAVRQISAR